MAGKKKLVQNKKVKEKGDNLKIDKYIFWVLLAITVIVPIIMRAKGVLFINPVIDPMTHSTGVQVTVYNYYKFVVLLIATFSLLGLFSTKLSRGYQIKKSYINFFLIFLAVIVLLSALFSHYKTIAMTGNFNHYEASLAYLCYFLIFFIAANTRIGDKEGKVFLYSLIPLIAIHVFLGLGNFLGYNPLDIEFIKKMIIPKDMLDYITRANFGSTINHPNYVSGIFGVLTTMFLAKAVLVDNNKKETIISSLLTVISFLIVLTTLSLSGFVTIVFLIPVVIMLALLGEDKSFKLLKLAILLVTYGVIFTILFKINEKIGGEFLTFFISPESSFKTPGLIGFVAMAFLFPATYFLAGLKRHTIAIISGVAISLLMISLLYVGFQEESYVFGGENSLQIQEALNNDEFALPQPAWTAGTGREYIWMRTLGLIVQKPLLGYGLDTLIYEFPQNDPLKIAGIYDYTTRIDKPHNMYLSIGYGAGVLALGTFLMLVMFHYFNTLALLRTRNLQSNSLVIALIVGWLAYLIQALFNDSILGTAPIFWIIFGISIALLNGEGERES